MSDIFADYSFGGWLRRWRIEKEIGLREMSRALGVDPSTICKIEKNQFAPPNTREKLKKLTAPLKLTTDQFDMLVGLCMQDHIASVRVKFDKDLK